MMECAYKATVLVVDDDAEVREATTNMLAAEGYRSVEAIGASQAIELLIRHEVDVMLTDIRMPGLSGLVLAQEAKRFQPHLHVIFTTGFLPQGQWDERRNGVVLRKPYRRSQLVAEIMKAIGGEQQEPNASSI